MGQNARYQEKNKDVL